jgi:amino acid transporter
VGRSFYNNANAAFWAGKGAIPIWPYPAMLASWLVHNKAFQVILLLVMSLWFFGWAGSLFLSSTQVIFAAAFDRVLADSAATVSERRKVPMASLVLMLLPAAALSAVYSYWVKFQTSTIDATHVTTWLISAFAVVILPWRKPELRKPSAASKFKPFGVPIVPVAGLATMVLVIYNLYEWLPNSACGVNDHGSLVFMALLYVLAIVVYVAARLIRKRQGIDLGLINKEIPPSRRSRVAAGSVRPVGDSPGALGIHDQDRRPVVGPAVLCECWMQSVPCGLDPYRFTA